MKITAEIKFNIGQDVFVICGDEVFPAKIVRACLRGTFNVDSSVYYILHGNFGILGIIRDQVGRNENEVYATRQEAIVELHNSQLQNMEQNLEEMKSTICQFARNYTISQCLTERHKKALRALKNVNKELYKILKDK